MKADITLARKIIAALCIIIGVSLMAASWMLLMAGNHDTKIIVEDVMGVIVTLGGYLLWKAANEIQQISNPP